MLLAVLLLAVAVLLGLTVAHHLWQSHRLTTARLSARSVAARVDPALVDLNVVLGDQSAEGAATGIVLSSSGLVLTNNHVVEGATQIKATDLGNGRTYGASVVGYDASRTSPHQAPGAAGLTAAHLGDQRSAVGQGVAGIGNAGGLGGVPTIARGTVVALGQQITASDALDGTSEQLSGLIETNADIQPGDSGGPLVDRAGRVLALDTAASSGFSFGSAQQHAGLAIPIDTAVSLVHKIENGQASAAIHIGPTAFLGVQLRQCRAGAVRLRRLVLIGCDDRRRPARHAGGARRTCRGQHDRLGRRAERRFARRPDHAARRVQARREGRDRLGRRGRRPACKHGDAGLGTGALR